MRKHKYLYIHQFDWKVNEMAFQEEPRVGGVYLAEETEKAYKITFPIDDDMITGFVLEKKLMKGEFETWDCDIEEVAIDNLMDLKIATKDLKMMAEGSEGDYDMDEEMDIGMAKEMWLLDELGDSLSALRDFDVEHYEALTSMATKISDAISSPSYIQLTDGLSFDPKSARIANISIAANLLESHINNKNELDLSDLLDAVYYLTLEVIRIHKTNKLVKNIK